MKFYIIFGLVLEFLFKSIHVKWVWLGDVNGVCFIIIVLLLLKLRLNPICIKKSKIYDFWHKKRIFLETKVFDTMVVQTRRKRRYDEDFKLLTGLFSWNSSFLRVVKTQAILILKAMSERVVFDMERPWIRMRNFQIDSKSIWDDEIQIQGRYRSDPTLSDIDFKNKMASKVSTSLNEILIFQTFRQGHFFMLVIRDRDCFRRV